MIKTICKIGGNYVKHKGYEAYLVATIDTTKQPYQVISAGIYSESARQLTIVGPGYCNVDVLSMQESSFAEASQRLIDLIAHDSHFKWVVDVLPESVQREIAIKDVIT